MRGATLQRQGAAVGHRTAHSTPTATPPGWALHHGVWPVRKPERLSRGGDVVDLRAALDATLACRPAWVVVEQDGTKGEPAESIRISREYLRSLGA